MVIVLPMVATALEKGWLEAMCTDVKNGATVSNMIGETKLSDGDPALPSQSKKFAMLYETFVCGSEAFIERDAVMRDWLLLKNEREVEGAELMRTDTVERSTDLVKLTEMKRASPSLALDVGEYELFDVTTIAPI